MLATVVNSPIAIQVTKQIMRIFTKMWEFALNYKDIAKRIDEAFELLHQILQDTQKTNSRTFWKSNYSEILNSSIRRKRKLLKNNIQKKAY